MGTAVNLSPVEEDVLRARFSFPEKDLRAYHYALQYYPRDLTARGGRMTAKQEETCLELTRTLDRELVRLCEFVPPEGHRAGQVSLSAEEANLLEYALRSLALQNKAAASSSMAALDRFQRDTRLVFAVLATEKKQ